ncbi:hypothetical protein CBS147346_91 [Aspergillus niger]|nr:hypothetical protein CBS147346_91 [Aspergillus niger]
MRVIRRDALFLLIKFFSFMLSAASLTAGFGLLRCGSRGVSPPSLQHLPIREQLNYKAEIDWINTLCLDHHDGCS